MVHCFASKLIGHFLQQHFCIYVNGNETSRDTTSPTSKTSWSSSPSRRTPTMASRRCHVMCTGEAKVAPATREKIWGTEEELAGIAEGINHQQQSGSPASTSASPRPNTILTQATQPQAQREPLHQRGEPCSEKKDPCSENGDPCSEKRDPCSEVAERAAISACEKRPIMCNRADVTSCACWNLDQLCCFRDPEQSRFRHPFG